MGRRQEIIQKIIDNCVFIDAPKDKSELHSKCWLWQGADSGSGRGGGYGRMSLDGGTVAVHKAAWINEHGMVPPGKQLDHLCERRICCNPGHLELLTHKQNQKRRDAAAKKRSE